MTYLTFYIIKKLVLNIDNNSNYIIRLKESLEKNIFSYIFINSV